MMKENEKIQQAINKGELYFSEDKGIWAIGPYTGKTKHEAWRAYQQQIKWEEMKPNRKEILKHITSCHAADGPKADTLKFYFENRISYQSYTQAKKEGLKIYDQTRQAT